MRHALVTGPSAGIGQQIALGLAGLGFHIVAAGRSRARIDPVVGQIIESGGSAEFLHLDLAALDSVQKAAAIFEASNRMLDVLINNAGVGIARGVTEDGFQVQFGVNHLGHFLLTDRLRGTFQRGTRIVSISSHMHHRAKSLDFDRLKRKTSTFGGVEAYSQSKLANILFIRELARRDPDLLAVAVHPGMVDTGILPAWGRPFVRGRVLSPVEGADTAIWAATSPDLDGSTGGYFARRTEAWPSELARDPNLAAELWDRSEQWCRPGR